MRYVRRGRNRTRGGQLTEARTDEGHAQDFAVLAAGELAGDGERGQTAELVVADGDERHLNGGNFLADGADRGIDHAHEAVTEAGIALDLLGDLMQVSGFLLEKLEQLEMTEFVGGDFGDAHGRRSAEVKALEERETFGAGGVEGGAGLHFFRDEGGEGRKLGNEEAAFRL